MERIGRTTDEQRAKLRLLGFVRVDGLKIRAKTIDGEFEYPISSDPSDRGRYGGNNGYSVICPDRTPEVWLTIGGFPPEKRNIWESLLKELCPNGEGAFVPCSNGEEIIDWRQLLARVRDPDYNPPAE
jgi:hypothetical protein